MQARAQQGFFALANGFAEAKDDGFFLRAYFEKSGNDESCNHQSHDDFDNRKAAAQRLSQCLRTGILRFRFLGPMVVLVLVLVMIVAVHCAKSVIARARRAAHLSGCS